MCGYICAQFTHSAQSLASSPILCHLIGSSVQIQRERSGRSCYEYAAMSGASGRQKVDKWEPLSHCYNSQLISPHNKLYWAVLQPLWLHTVNNEKGFWDLPSVEHSAITKSPRLFLHAWSDHIAIGDRIEDTQCSLVVYMQWVCDITVYCCQQNVWNVSYLHLFCLILYWLLTSYSGTDTLLSSWCACIQKFGIKGENLNLGQIRKFYFRSQLYTMRFG